MKIAMVSATPPFPCNAGNRARILSLARALRALGHELHFLYLELTPWAGADRAAMEAEFGKHRLHWIRSKSTARTSLVRRALRNAGRRLNLRSAYQFELDDWHDEALNPQIAAIDHEQGFDAVFVEYVFSSKAFEAFGPRTLRVLDTHDSFGDRYKRLREAGPGAAWYSTTPANEVRGFRRADVVLAIQEEEAEHFRARICTERPEVLTVSHLLDVEDVGLHHLPAASFLASGNQINVDGLAYFIDDVLPIVRAARPDFKLYLGGQICERVPDAESVVKLGRVDRPSDLFAVGPIAINPVRTGTGINIKLLDALASGAPVVSTETGVRGLSGAYQAGVRVAGDHDPQSFASALIGLFDDPADWRTLSRAALESAQAWNASHLRQLDFLLQKTSPGR